MSNPKIGWGEYGGFEGPFCWGSKTLPIVANPTWNDNLLRVISATEGHYDSVNMYDKCIVSVGCVQWGEACNNGSVTRLIKEVAQQLPTLVYQNFTGLPGGWNQHTGTFVELPSQKQITNPELMRKIYLGGSSGAKGAWTDPQKTAAKKWCLAFARLFQNDKACEIQRDYSARELEKYKGKVAKEVLWDGTEGAYQDALRLIYMSYSANLPSTTEKYLKLGLQSATEKGFEKWSPEWLWELVESWRSKAKVGIWPGRYSKIKPVIEDITCVSLP